MQTFLVMLAIWIVIGLLVGVLAGSLWGGARPMGAAVDYTLAVGASVLTGLVDWFLVPRWFDFGPTVVFIIAVFEPLFVALLILWIVRRVRR